LVVFPAGFGPKPTWRLAWLFALPRLKARDAYQVAIAADNGQVLQTLGSMSAVCSSINAAAPSSVTPGVPIQLDGCGSMPEQQISRG
jgi:hypothetical protein